MSKLYTITLNGVTEEVYNKATDYIEKHALRLNYRPEVSTIDAEFPDDIDPAKSPELQEAYIRNVRCMRLQCVKTYHKFRKRKPLPPVSRLRRGFFWYPIEFALCHLYPTLMRRPRPLSDLKISGRIKYNYHRNKELPLCQRKSSVESTVFRLFKLSH